MLTGFLLLLFYIYIPFLDKKNVQYDEGTITSPYSSLILVDEGKLVL